MKISVPGYVYTELKLFQIEEYIVGIKTSSYSEYKFKNGLSCIGQFRNLGQNGTCYHIVFDESTDIRMYIYEVVLNQNTPVV